MFTCSIYTILLAYCRHGVLVFVSADAMHHSPCYRNKVPNHFRPSKRAIERLSQSKSRFESCGYRNPAAFCQSARPTYGGFIGGYANTPSVYSLMVTMIIISIQIARYLSIHHEESVRKTVKWSQFRAQKVGLNSIYTRIRFAIPNRIRNNTVEFCYFIAWSFTFLSGLLAFLPNDTPPGSGGQGQAIDMSNWSFGQVVAIAVWAGPLLEYFHLSIREWQLNHLPSND